MRKIPLGLILAILFLARICSLKTKLQPTACKKKKEATRTRL